jgi:hypothetical protein
LSGVPASVPSIGGIAWLGAAMASVRQLASGRWQLRVHSGRDPVNGPAGPVSIVAAAVGGGLAGLTAGPRRRSPSRPSQRAPQPAATLRVLPASSWLRRGWLLLPEHHDLATPWVNDQLAKTHISCSTYDRDMVGRLRLC